MNRRDALSRVAYLMGGAVIGADFFLSGCNTGDKSAGLPLSKEQVSFLDEVAETIIPATDSPGAKAAKVGEFMNTMVTDCYNQKDQLTFLTGITRLDEASNKVLGLDFINASPAQKKELLNTLDTEAKQHEQNKKPEDAAHYFTMMKQLTLLGYFTSEQGATKALRYIAVPQRYEGCIPYNAGDRAWAQS